MFKFSDELNKMITDKMSGKLKKAMHNIIDHIKAGQKISTRFKSC